MQSAKIEKVQSQHIAQGGCNGMAAEQQTCAACGAVIAQGYTEGVIRTLQGKIYCQKCYATKLISAKLQEKLGLSPDLVEKLLYTKKD